MTREFPPTPTRPTEIEFLLAAFATVAGAHEATYVSSPLTTGRLAAEWSAHNDVAHPEDALVLERFRSDVVAANKARATSFVHTLREHRPELRPVISPTELAEIKNWTQSDYRYFWGRLIAAYAARVVFLDGWENSSGCAYEYLVAIEAAAVALDERLDPLPVAEAIEKLELAAAHASQQATAPFLRAVQSALRSGDLLSGRAGR